MKMGARRGDPSRSSCVHDVLTIWSYVSTKKNHFDIFEVAKIHELSQLSSIHQDPNTIFILVLVFAPSSFASFFGAPKSKASLEPPTQIGEIREELDGYFVSRMQFVDLNRFPSKLRALRIKKQWWSPVVSTQHRGKHVALSLSFSMIVF